MRALLANLLFGFGVATNDLTIDFRTAVWDSTGNITLSFYNSGNTLLGDQSYDLCTTGAPCTIGSDQKTISVDATASVNDIVSIKVKSTGGNWTAVDFLNIHDTSGTKQFKTDLCFRDGASNIMNPEYQMTKTEPHLPIVDGIVIKHDELFTMPTSSPLPYKLKLRLNRTTNSTTENLRPCVQFRGTISKFNHPVSSYSSDPGATLSRFYCLDDYAKTPLYNPSSGSWTVGTEDEEMIIVPVDEHVGTLRELIFAAKFNAASFEIHELKVQQPHMAAGFTAEWSTIPLNLDPLTLASSISGTSLAPTFFEDVLQVPYNISNDWDGTDNDFSGNVFLDCNSPASYAVNNSRCIGNSTTEGSRQTDHNSTTMPYIRTIHDFTPHTHYASECSACYNATTGVVATDYEVVLNATLNCTCQPIAPTPTPATSSIITCNNGGETVGRHWEGRGTGADYCKICRCEEPATGTVGVLNCTFTRHHQWSDHTSASAVTAWDLRHSTHRQSSCYNVTDDQNGDVLWWKEGETKPTDLQPCDPTHMTCNFNDTVAVTHHRLNEAEDYEPNELNDRYRLDGTKHRCAYDKINGDCQCWCHTRVDKTVYPQKGRVTCKTVGTGTVTFAKTFARIPEVVASEGVIITSITTTNFTALDCGTLAADPYYYAYDGKRSNDKRYGYAPWGGVATGSHISHTGGSASCTQVQFSHPFCRGLNSSCARPLVFVTCDTLSSNCHVKSTTHEGFELCADANTTATYMAFENRRPQTHPDNLTPFGYKLAGRVNAKTTFASANCTTIQLSNSSNLDHAGYPTAPYPHGSMSNYLDSDPGAGVNTVLVSSGGDTDSSTSKYYVDSVSPGTSFQLCTTSEGSQSTGDYVDWVAFADLPTFTQSFTS